MHKVFSSRHRETRVARATLQIDGAKGAVENGTNDAAPGTFPASNALARGLTIRIVSALPVGERIECGSVPDPFQRDVDLALRRIARDTLLIPWI